MQNKIKLKIKNEYIISFKDKYRIVDTIVSKNDTIFMVFNRKTKKLEKKKTFMVDKTMYLPIKVNSNFLKTGILLLASDVKPYGCKEDLLKEIQGYIHKYVDISDDYRIIVSYYVLLSYVYERFSEIPYLRVLGDYGSGKSRLLKVITSICYNATMVSGGTSLAAIFRTIDKVNGTLMLDEADFGYSGTQSDIIKLLNNGYQKGFPLMRADGERFDVSSYEIYGPKIIGGRYEFQDKALESRCLVNIMKKTKRKDIPTGFDATFYNKTQELRNKLLKFRYDYFDKIKVKTDIINGIEPRLSQIINPILSLVDDKDKSDLIIKSILNKQSEIKEDRKNSIFGGILEYLKFNCQGRNEFSFQDIINQLDNTDGKHNITHRKLGSILKQNRLKTKRKNSGTVLPYYDNMMELNRLYEEYGIK